MATTSSEQVQSLKVYLTIDSYIHSLYATPATTELQIDVSLFFYTYIQNITAPVVWLYF